MVIWIDGDACPKMIKHILFRAAMKRQVMVIMVANHLPIVPPSPFIKRVKVDSGFDKADNYIVMHLKPQDLVITADIILADEVVTKEAFALNPRGMLYTANNIKQILNIRHMNESLRESGLIRSGLESLSPKEIQNFSNHLDKIISLSSV
ncbi:MAG: YaiI/YqxD family protein [Legionella sp.]|nr:YaiI/YqxD family protein [Legionella sp.]